MSTLVDKLLTRCPKLQVNSTIECGKLIAVYTGQKKTKGGKSRDTSGTFDDQRIRGANNTDNSNLPALPRPTHSATIFSSGRYAWRHSGRNVGACHHDIRKRTYLQLYPTTKNSECCSHFVQANTRRKALTTPLIPMLIHPLWLRVASCSVPLGVFDEQEIENKLKWGKRYCFS